MYVTHVPVAAIIDNIVLELLTGLPPSVKFCTCGESLGLFPNLFRLFVLLIVLVYLA